MPETLALIRQFAAAIAADDSSATAAIGARLAALIGPQTTAALAQDLRRERRAPQAVRARRPMAPVRCA
jgi:hypothetical protein